MSKPAASCINSSLLCRQEWMCPCFLCAIEREREKWRADYMVLQLKGDVNALRELLQEDPLVLERVTLTCFGETPLHIAVMKGHVDFVKEILQQNPQLAMELDSKQSSPLHMASAKGNVEIVKALLEVNLDMCSACDKDGRNPLHLAAMRGRVEILKLLVQQRPSAALGKVYGSGDTILHSCVKHHQLKVLKMLMQNHPNDPHELVNAKNDDGNTVLHLAVVDKQIKTINYLLLHTSVEVNAVNLYGLTAMDILNGSIRDMKYMYIREALSRAGAIGAKSSSPQHSIQYRARNALKKNSEDDLFKQLKDDWLERKRNVLMIVASLIATMTFQAGLNPPGGFWQDAGSEDAGRSIWARQDPHFFGLFMTFNTVGFLASLSIILLLISGLPLRHKAFVYIFMVIMWVAVSAIAITYRYSVAATTIWNGQLIATGLAVEYLMLLWLVVSAGFLLLGHSIRFIIKVVKALSKLVRRKKNRIKFYN